MVFGKLGIYMQKNEVGSLLNITPPKKPLKKCKDLTAKPKSIQLWQKNIEHENQSFETLDWQWLLGNDNKISGNEGKKLTGLHQNIKLLCIRAYNRDSKMVTRGKKQKTCFLK
jgi:hypothetical protein